MLTDRWGEGQGLQLSLSLSLIHFEIWWEMAPCVAFDQNLESEEAFFFLSWQEAMYPLGILRRDK